MSVDEFWNSGLEDTILTIQAYDNRVLADWQQTRLIVYTVACTVTKAEDRKDIFDFLPLKGDPSPEVRQQAAEDAYNKMLADQKNFTQSLRAEKIKADNG